jgi:hypothetical protein
MAPVRRWLGQHRARALAKALAPELELLERDLAVVASAGEARK